MPNAGGDPPGAKRKGGWLRGKGQGAYKLLGRRAGAWPRAGDRRPGAKKGAEPEWKQQGGGKRVARGRRKSGASVRDCGPSAMTKFRANGPRGQEGTSNKHDRGRGGKTWGCQVRVMANVNCERANKGLPRTTCTGGYLSYILLTAQWRTLRSRWRQ